MGLREDIWAKNRGRGVTEQSGPGHGHSELMSKAAHDQELHQQFVMPFRTETGDAGGTAAAGSGGAYNDIATDTIDVPTWAERASVVTMANFTMGSTTSDSTLEGRTSIEGTNGKSAIQHHGASENTGVTAVQSHTVTSLGSTITVKAQASETNGETVSTRLVWMVIFERFE